MGWSFCDLVDIVTERMRLCEENLGHVFFLPNSQNQTGIEQETKNQPLQARKSQAIAVPC